MKTEKILLLTLLFAIAIRIIFSYPLDNRNLISGTDSSSHLFESWYIAEKGYTRWNYYWYGGTEFLKYYPPLSYMIIGNLGKLIGYLLSYKLIVNIFFILTPLAFYFFVKEFKFQKNIVILSSIVFSLFPIYFYYFADGRHTTIINLLFLILFWKFLKNAVDTNKTKSFMSAALFLALAALTHVTTTFLVLIIVTVWLVLYSFNKKSIIQFLKIGLLGFLIVAWWWIPFLLGTYKTNIQIPSTSLIEKRPYFFEIFKILFDPHYYYPIFSIGAAVVLSLIALPYLKMNKEFRTFFILLFFIILLIFLFRYKRTILFLPIPLSIIISFGILYLKKNLKIISILILLTILLFTSISIKKYIFPYPEIPDVQKDGRVIYLPSGGEFYENKEDRKYLYSTLLAPLNGNENIFGYFEPSQAMGKVGENKVLYLTNIGYLNLKFPYTVDQKEYYELLKNGWVNYVIVNKYDINYHYTKLKEYFKENEYFNLINETNLFYVYELNPKSSYVEINNENIRNISIKKQGDEIFLSLYCKKGIMTIKETYNDNWKGFLNGNSIKLDFNDFAFIQTEVDKEGPCDIRLYFSEPRYYIAFKLISIITLLVLTVFMIRYSNK